ncbi:MAG: glycogen/starch synthase [Bacteroidota bacterium]|nr:glycogen/starch synthase [Bacteroidota bacterium]
MDKKRILFISQEITPYLPENQLSKSALEVAKKMNDQGHEVRVFMPRFGVINERRHQLHEVIRLSGINIVINDMDMPLIIKVASVPQTRMQVYFIDNDEFFKRKQTYFDKEHKFFEDNAERSVFFCKGVIETIKKLGWKPDIIHVHGWMASLVPTYLKLFNNDDPLFSEAKVVESVYSKGFEGELNENLTKAMEFDNVQGDDLEFYKKPYHTNMIKASLRHVDGVVKADDKIDEDLLRFINDQNLPIFEGSHLISSPGDIEKFYEALVMEEEVA